METNKVHVLLIKHQMVLFLVILFLLKALLQYLLAELVVDFFDFESLCGLWIYMTSFIHLYLGFWSFLVHLLCLWSHICDYVSYLYLRVVISLFVGLFGMMSESLSLS